MSCGGGHLEFSIGIKKQKLLKPNCPGMINGRSSTKFLFFYSD
jgi:hypothetical protein